MNLNSTVQHSSNISGCFLGDLRISPELIRLKSRQRLFDLFVQIGGLSYSQSTTMTALISEMLRSLEHLDQIRFLVKEDQSRVLVEYAQNNQRKAAFKITLPQITTENDEIQSTLGKSIQSWSEFGLPLNAIEVDEAKYIQLHIPIGRSLSDQELTQAKSLLAQKSLEELTAELTEQNKQLGEHQRGLEEAVRRRTEELEVEKVRAEEATAAKSMFLANMSHEIRTPMNAIIGLSHLALQNAVEPSLKDYLKKIHTAGTSLLTIINDILDFSKIEAGELKFEKKRFSINDLIEELSAINAHSASIKGVELTVIVDPELPNNLIGDALRLKQVLTNLLSNAIKFTQEGEVVLAIEWVSPERGNSQGSGIRFSVKDSGIGMSVDQVNRLFRPFSQADESTTRRFGGTGLGLTISQRLVELMGGRINLKSALGEGSEFWFILPQALETSSQQVSDPIEDQLISLRGQKALIVENSLAARTSLELLLERLSLEVSWASGVEEGRGRFDDALKAGEPFDWVFLDWKLDDGSGLELLQDWGKLEATATLMVTAYGDEEMNARARKMGAVATLHKPLTASQLHDALINALYQRGHISEYLSRAMTPIADHDQLSGASEADPWMALHGRRILLVEDNEINQLVATGLLGRVNVDVVVASDGEEGVFIATQDSKFDLVLMDIQMPKLDGYQATMKLRASGFSAPIIAMTAHAMTEERVRCLEAGMNDHITKPINPSLLYRTLVEWLPKEQKMPHGEAVSSIEGEADLNLIDDYGQTMSPKLNKSLATSSSIEISSWRESDLINRELGIELIGGSEEVYDQLLTMFVSHIDQLETLAAPLITGERALDEALRDNLERLTHTLKGSGSQLGLTLLAQKSGHLEKDLAQNRFDLPALAQLLKIAHKTADLITPSESIASSFQETTPHSKPLSEDEMNELNTLVERLLEADFEAVDQVHACLDKLRQIFGEGFKPWMIHVESFNLLEAGEVLRTALNGQRKK